MIFGELDRRVELHNVNTTANDYGELTRTYTELRVINQIVGRKEFLEIICEFKD